MRSGQSTPRGGVVRPTAIMATSPHQKGGRGFKHMPLALPEHGLGSPGGRFGAGVLDSPVLLPTFTAEPSPTTGTYPLGGSAFRGTAQGIQHLPTPKASEKKASALGRVSSARQAAANYASARSGAASYATASAHQQQQPHQPYHNPQTAARRRLQVLDDAQPSGSSSDDDDAIHVVQGARSLPAPYPTSSPGLSGAGEPGFWAHERWVGLSRTSRRRCAMSTLAHARASPSHEDAPRDYLNPGSRVRPRRGARVGTGKRIRHASCSRVLPYTVALGLIYARPTHPSRFPH